MTTEHDPGLVGLVAFGGFGDENQSAEICAPGSSPRAQGVVGLVAFAGFSDQNQSAEISRLESSPAAPGAVGPVGFGGCSTHDGRAEISDVDPTHEMPEGSPLGLATAARGVLETLQESGFFFSLSAAGALLVSPASALRDDQREAIRAHRTGLALLVQARDAADLHDERRRCQDCSNLRPDGVCAVAAAGLMPGVSRAFQPLPAQLQRCTFFRAYWLKEFA